MISICNLLISSHIKWFCLVSLVFLTVSNSYSKDFPYIRFKNFTYENGLPENMVYDIVKDTSGFVWIGSSNGLFRYDGMDFKTFYHDENNENTPAGNQIECVLIDSENYLWVGTRENGVSRYDIEKSIFTNYSHEKDNPNSLTNREVLCLMEDSKGRIWIGTENGLNVLDKKREHITRFFHDDKDSTSLSAPAVLSLMEDSQGRIWTGTWGGGLNLLLPEGDDIKNTTFRRFTHDPLKKETLSNDNVWSLFEDSQQRIWIGTFGGGLNLMIPDLIHEGLVDFSPQFISFQKNPQSDNTICGSQIYSINEDESGFLWIGTGSGLSIVDSEVMGETKFIDANVSGTIPTLNFKSYYHSTYNTSLTNNLVRNVFIDDEKCVWLSTFAGISQYDGQGIRFKAMMTAEEVNDNIGISSLIVETPELHWVASWDFGLIKYNPKTGDQQVFGADPDNLKALVSNEIIRLYRHRSGDIWIGTDLGYSVFDIETETFSNFAPQDKAGEIRDLRVSSFYRDSKERLWMGTGSGLVRIYEDESSARYELIQAKDVTNPDSLIAFEATNIVEDTYGNIWTTSWNGLNKMSTNTDGEFELTCYNHDSENPNSIASDRVTYILAQGDDFWVGTESGLSHYIHEQDKFINYGIEQGLDMVNMASLQIDDEGKIWGATRQGLFSLNPENGKIRQFFKDDGLQSNTFSFLSTYKDEEGNLYFGGNAGYTQFHPKDVQQNESIPPIAITGFQIFNKEKNFDKPINTLDEIELSHTQNYFTIRFSALNYIQSFRNRYKYMLEGFDENWIDAGSRNFASYTNLNGGTYTFRVKGSNNDGVWNKEGTSIKIKVIPPFYWTWWFWAIVVASALVLIYLFSRFRNKALRERSRELEAYNAKLNREIEVRQHTENILREREQKLTEAEKQLEETIQELQRSNQELEQFAYIASHDLQEPLRMVGSFVQLIGRKYSDKIDDSGREYIAFAIDGVNRMSELIKGLLSFSRVGRQNANFEISDLNTIVEKKMLDIRNYTIERKAEVHTNTLPTQVFCDSTQIGAIFYNLIVNAIKFNKKEKPTVDVRLANENQDEYLFSVKDNGIGISQDYKERVFEVFKRLNSNDEFKGSGIGLALCKRIIDNHQGEIWFESEEGQGTTFFFTISKKLDTNSPQIYQQKKLKTVA